MATLAMAALVSTLLTAGSNSTTLPNGAELAVSIGDPVTGTEFEVPPGQPTIDVAVSGTASVGLGDPDATFTYVMDVSGSTDNGSGTGCAPVLDCEQDFLRELNQAVIDSGSADEVGLVVFSSTAATADLSPDPGDQLIVAPDAPGSAPLYLNTVINSTFSVFGGNGGVAQFTNKVTGVTTNCTAGMQSALNVLRGNVKPLVTASDRISFRTAVVGECREAPRARGPEPPARTVSRSDPSPPRCSPTALRGASPRSRRGPARASSTGPCSTLAAKPLFGEQQPDLDGQQLDVGEADLDVAGDHQALVEDPFEDVRQALAGLGLAAARAQPSAARCRLRWRCSSCSAASRKRIRLLSRSSRIRLGYWCLVFSKSRSMYASTWLRLRTLPSRRSRIRWLGYSVARAFSRSISKYWSRAATFVGMRLPCLRRGPRSAAPPPPALRRETPEAH